MTPEGIAARLRASLGAFHLDVDLHLPGRGVTALFGPSGAGKTTVLRCLAGLQRVAGGHVFVNGELWQEAEGAIFVPPHRRAIGYVFQEANLFSHLDVRGNLAFGMCRLAPGRRRVAWEEAIEMLGVGPLLDRRVATLSGGERQRVAIARALLCSPRLLLLDEPLASLDAPRKQEILPYLERLHEELAIPVLYVSHAQEEIARIADHVVLVQEGRVLAHGPLAQMLTSLDLPLRLGEDAGVVLQGQVGVQEGEWHLARVDFEGGSLWVRDGGAPVGRTVRVRILARDVSVARERPGPSSIANTLPAVLEGLATGDHPALLLARLQVGGSFLLARLTRRSAQELQLTPGARVFVQVKAAALL